MDYGEILTRGWKIIWKHKILWIFGILASCSGGSNNLSNGSRYSMDQGGQGPFGEWFGRMSSEQLTMIAIAILALVCILTIVAVFLSTMGRIGLIRGASRADQDLEAHLTFGDLFREGMGYFWRIFLLNLMLGILSVIVFGSITLLVLAGGLGAAAAGNAREVFAAGLGVGTLILVACLCCLFIPIFVVISVILELVYRAIVVEDLGIGAGIARGWEVFKANLGPVALIWVIVLVIGLVSGLIISVPMFLVALPMMASVLAGRNAMSAGFVMSLICFVAYLPVLLVLQGIITSYVQSVWTIVYRRFIGLAGGSSLSSSPPTGGGAAVFDANPPEIPA